MPSMASLVWGRMDYGPTDGQIEPISDSLGGTKGQYDILVKTIVLKLFIMSIRMLQDNIGWIAFEFKMLQIFTYT